MPELGEQISIELAQWQDDCRSQLALEHENEVFLKFVLLAGILGYEEVAYGLEFPNSVPRPDFCFFANFLPDWQEKFVDRHPKHHGAMIAHGKRTAELEEGDGMRWHRADFAREAALNEVEFAWYEKLRRAANTTVFVGLAGPANTADMVISKKTRVLIDLTIESMARCLIPKNMPQAKVELSEAERICLQWVLDGKSADLIAGIMATKRSAIDYMQRQLCDRFDKSSIFATAVLALRMGFLDDETADSNLPA